MGKHLVTLRAFVLLVAGITSIACGGDDGGDGGGNGPQTLAIAKAASNSGDGQSATVNTQLTNPLRVLVTEGGAPAEGVEVNWTTEDGTITPSGPTGGDGIAAASWTLGTTSGSQTAAASLTGATGSPVTFTATASPGPPAQLGGAGGNEQSGEPGAELPEPLRVKASDAFGNGTSGVTITWEVVSGDATVSPTSNTTDAAGLAQTRVTLGSTPGTISITATAEGLQGSPLPFTATALSAATVSVANNSFTPVSQTVPAGTTVRWVWAAGAVNHNVAPDVALPVRSGDPASAPNQYEFTFTTPGTYRYHCEVHGAAGGVGMSGTIVVTP